MQSAEAERGLLPEPFRGAEACFQPLPPIHPPEAQLERFMRGELSRAEVRPLVRHMLSGCPECLKVTRPIWKLMQREPKRPGGRR
jgi:hypothetical protein